MATPRSLTTTFANAAMVCFAYFGFALLLMHVLRPDFSPVNHMMSDYAVGPYGWVMQTAFLALSGGILFLLLGLLRSGPTSIPARLGELFLAVAVIGLVVSAFYKTDVGNVPETREGFIHSISFLVNVVSIILAFMLLSISFGSHPRWLPYRRRAVILAVLVVLCFFLQFFTLHRGMPYGLTNRLFVVAILTWLLSTSFRLRALVSE